MLIPITFTNPGVNSEVLRYQNTGGFTDASRVRFWYNSPRSTLGSTLATDDSFQGVCRGMHAWQTNIGTIDVALGTTAGLYIFESGKIYDITPIERVNTVDDPFTSFNGFAIVEVRDPAHGAETGDQVQIKATTLVGGLNLNGTFTISKVDENVYEVTVTVNGQEVFATATEVGGGPGCQLQYLLAPGSSSATPDLGWGAGHWGDDAWGTPRSIANVSLDARTCNMDNWGQDLIFNARGGGVFYWFAGDTGTRTVSLANYIASIQAPGAPIDPEMPNIAETVLVSMPDRHLCVYGADENLVQDRMLVKWSDTENLSIWTPDFNNTAGSQKLNGGTKILAAVHVGSEILILTDTDAIAQRFEGAPYVFGFFNIASNCGLVAPKAVVSVNGIAYWMGADNFYTYDGRVQPLDCPLRTVLLGGSLFSYNFGQRSKIHAGFNRQFGEVYWFYQSVESATDEVDMYVCYSTANQKWTRGILNRTTYLSPANYPVPLSTDELGNLIFEEFGIGEIDGSLFPSSFFTGEMELGNGDKQMYVNRFIPNILFFESVSGSKSYGDLTLRFRDWPNSPPVDHGPFRITESTEFIDLDARGRTVQLIWDGHGVWQWGKCRLSIQSDGKTP